MQVNDKLKPCPFCGGEAEIQVGEYTSFVDGYAVRCGNCSLTFGAYGRIGETYCWSCCFETEDEAIESWNTRAERTCKMTKKGPEYVLGGWFECSECGVVYPPCNDDISAWALQYCPRCGAKVVSDV